MTFHTIMWAEMKPDCYSGDTCDQLEPRWECFAEGDRDSEHSPDDIVLDPKLFPPGTKISIQVPICPECRAPNWSYECPPAPCECGFDWEEWACNRYG